MQNRAASVVAETDVIKFHFAVNVVQRHGAFRILIFGAFVENLLRALQTSQSFGELGSNGNDLHDGCDQEPEKKSVGEEAADGERARHDLVRAHVHDDRSHHSHQHACRETHDGGGGESAHYVIQQALHASGENGFFALLSVVSL